MQKTRFFAHRVLITLKAGMNCLCVTRLMLLAVLLTTGPRLPTAFAEPLSIVDPALVGVWEQRVANPSGVARWEINIEDDGTFTFRGEGPGAPPSYTGTFRTTGGTWALSAPAINW